MIDAMSCPKCRCRDQIDIQALVWVRVSPEGADPDTASDHTHEWDSNSHAGCAGCGWSGRVGTLKDSVREAEA